MVNRRFQTHDSSTIPALIPAFANLLIARALEDISVELGVAGTQVPALPDASPDLPRQKTLIPVLEYSASSIQTPTSGVTSELTHQAIRPYTPPGTALNNQTIRASVASENSSPYGPSPAPTESASDSHPLAPLNSRPADSAASSHQKLALLDNALALLNASPLEPTNPAPNPQNLAASANLALRSLLWCHTDSYEKQRVTVQNIDAFIKSASNSQILAVLAAASALVKPQTPEPPNHASNSRNPAASASSASNSQILATSDSRNIPPLDLASGSARPDARFSGPANPASNNPNSAAYNDQYLPQLKAASASDPLNANISGPTNPEFHPQNLLASANSSLNSNSLAATTISAYEAAAAAWSNSQNAPFSDVAEPATRLDAHSPALQTLCAAPNSQNSSSLDVSLNVASNAARRYTGLSRSTNPVSSPQSLATFNSRNPFPVNAAAGSTQLDNIRVPTNPVFNPQNLDPSTLQHPAAFHDQSPFSGNAAWNAAWNAASGLAQPDDFPGPTDPMVHPQRLAAFNSQFAAAPNSQHFLSAQEASEMEFASELARLKAQFPTSAMRSRNGLVRHPDLLNDAASELERLRDLFPGCP